jgi:hypothetical protein
MGGLEPPLGSIGAELDCSDDRAERYMMAAGTTSDYGVVLFDTDPPAAVEVAFEEAGEPGFALFGSTQEGDYRFFIVNQSAIAEGDAPVVRDSLTEPNGIRLVLELERPSLGSVELDSLGGEIEFTRAGDGELAGGFEAALGSATDEFQGCFHVDLPPRDAQ